MSVEERSPHPTLYAEGEHGRPSVSVCIPAFNAEAWIERAVRSALQQTRGDLEVVVVDNASTDATRERVQRIDDSRVRLYANVRNLGVYRNFNRAISLSSGRYIQFLCADDVLLPDCVESMVDVFESDPRVGLCFSPRQILLEDPSDSHAAAWKAKHERTHTLFGDLEAVNSGDRLLAAWLDDQLASNWIGEPSNVMMSRECLRSIGTFPLNMHNVGDQDLWTRAMLDHAIGFVDRPLVEYAVRAGSLNSVNRETGDAWLDRLWFLEGLMTFEGFRKRYPRIRWLRAKAIMRSARHAWSGKSTPKTGKRDDFGRYLRFRLREHRDRSKLYGTIDDRGEPGETVAVGPRGDERSALSPGG